MFPLSDSVKSNKSYLVNFAIIAITVYVFVRQITAPDPENFTIAYSLIPSFVDFGNLATLLPFVTSIFLHGGFLHIISNMWFLWVFGNDVEGHLGHIMFVVLYFLSGFAGGLAQYILQPASSIPMLGASGAVAGVLGAYLAMFPHAKIKTLAPIFGFVTIMNIGAPVMLGYWFLLQVISGVVSLPGSGETGGIAFFAHAGGFAFGYLFGKLFEKKELGRLIKVKLSYKYYDV